MGNHQNSNKLREKVKIVLKKKLSNQFNQLPIQVISLISSFLTIKDYNHVLLVSSTTYHIFGQVSSSYQIHCQNILKIQSEIIQSKNWKKIVYQLHCIPIKGLPYERSLKSICHNIKQHPIYVENEKNYSTFQKCILYFEDQFNLFYTIEYQQVKKFASENFDILLKLRQGEEINIQLPQMLMNIYNIQDFIRIFNLYLEIRFENCDLEQFLQLWDRYCGWISIIEWSTLQLISQFNQIIQEILNKFKLPKFTFRHYMTTQWIKQYDKIKYRFQSEFQKKLINSRLKNQNPFILRRYIQYLIDVSTNQFNVHQYGYHNFPFNHEIQNLTELTTEIIKKINKDYYTDKQILIYIFGEQIFQQILFPNLTQFWIDQFKIEITKHSQNYYIVNETSENENQILIQYNKRQQIKNLINSILVKEECSSEILESKQSNNSLSQISLVSTNYSSVYTSQNEILLSYIKQTQIEFYQQMEDFFQIQDQINEQKLDFNKKQCYYDIPELCAYHEISSEKMLELLYNKKQPINKVLQQKISAKTTAQEMLFQVLN